MIVMFIAVASPTASYALMNAAIGAGLKPWKKKKQPGTTDSLKESAE
jgi:multisubunit Na+/H+ antiporter MnhG subunit